jgi:hypothetical protein
MGGGPTGGKRTGAAEAASDRRGTWAATAVGSAQKNSNLFDSFKGISKRSDLIQLKMDFLNLNIFK